ncbi:MAG: Ig-like domain-containing protein, partial [Solirubrobacterales bacterium]
VRLMDNGGTANGGDDTSDAQTFTITITGVNDAPVPQSAEYTIDEDGTLSGTLHATDVDSDTLAFQLAIAAGQGTLDLDADGNFTYTPNANYFGEDGFAFTVSDGQVTSDYATVLITINSVNDGPVAAENAYQVTEDRTFSVSLRALGVLGDDNDVDDAQSTLQAVLVDGPAHGVLTRTLAADGSWNGTFSYTPGADFAGNDTFTYRARDPHGALSDVTTVTLTVQNVNDAPVATDAAFTTDEDLPLALALPATDIDGDTLTFSILGGPAHGSLAAQTDGTYLYTPNADYYGSDRFTFQAKDAELFSNTATVSITVNPVNDAPVAQDAAVSTNEDTPLAIVLAATDIDSTALTLSIVEGPQHGSLALLQGAYVYTPDANYNGADAFTYKANDGALDSNAAVVSITVIAVNDKPVAAGASASTNEDTLLVGVLAASDVDGDTLTFSLGGSAAHGQVVVNANGTYSYTPNADFFGADSFTFKANDGSEDSNVATVTITVNPVNDAPVAQDSAVSTNEDTPLAIVLAATDIDSTALTLSVVDGPLHGSLALLQGAYVYTPNANYNGADSFTFKANDGELDSNVATVAITVIPVNDAPTVTDASASTNEDTLLAGVLAASDVDGDTLTFSLGGDAAHGHAVVNT